MANQSKPVRQEPAKKPAVPESAPPPRKSRLWLKILCTLFLLVLFLGSGLWAAVHFKVIEPQQLAAEYKLYDYPVIGKYFSRPLTNFEPVEPENLPEIVPPTKAAATIPAALAQNQPVPPTAAEVEKLAKQKQAEEAKRISRLARLYGEMAPDAAASILGQMDDDAVVSILLKMEDGQSAKILAAMDPKRAARLTGQMLKGK